MKCSSSIHHHPYHPPNDFGAEACPYICRLAPFETGFAFEWFEQRRGVGEAGAHLFYGIRESDAWTELALSGKEGRVDGLLPETDYAFYIAAADGVKSRIRLVRTGKNPDGATVIDYLHPDDEAFVCSGRYLCSPCMTRLRDGRLIASMDIFGTRMAQNLMHLFDSDDNGKTWHYLNDLYPMYWGTLFEHRDVLYVMGDSTEYGNLQIASSTDGGRTWSAPTTILYGSNLLCPFGGVHHPPMQIVSVKGRLYATFEYGSWERGSHLPGAVSIDENADLMVAENWVYTGMARFEGRWKAESPEQKQRDSIEGSLVLTKDGTLYEYLRWAVGTALRMRYDPDDPEKPPVFDRLLDMPVSNSMFRLMPDGDGYLLCTNRVPEHFVGRGFSPRMILSLYRSQDAEHFTFWRDIVDYSALDSAKNGFQYPCMLAEPDAIRLMVRSGYNGAHSFHDSNYMLYFEVEREESEPFDSIR